MSDELGDAELIGPDFALDGAAWERELERDEREVFNLILPFASSLVRTARREAVKQVEQVIGDERVSGETGEAEDFAYNNAIEHCILAVRRLSESEETDV